LKKKTPASNKRINAKIIAPSMRRGYQAACSCHRCNFPHHLPMRLCSIGRPGGCNFRGSYHLSPGLLDQVAMPGVLLMGQDTSCPLAGAGSPFPAPSARDLKVRHLRSNRPESPRKDRHHGQPASADHNPESLPTRFARPSDGSLDTPRVSTLGRSVASL